MQKIEQIPVNINSKLRELDYDEFTRSIKIMLHKIWMDSGAKMDDEMFRHTIKSLSYSIYNYHPSLVFCEIQAIFRGVSLGQYKVSRISSNAIMSALNEYLEAKRKRTVLDNDLDHKITRSEENYILSSGLNVGSALIFKSEQRESGNMKYENVPLKEIAEKLKSGELKLVWKSKRR